MVLRAILIEKGWNNFKGDKDLSGNFSRTQLKITASNYDSNLDMHIKVAAVLVDSSFSRQPKNEKFNRQFK